MDKFSRLIPPTARILAAENARVSVTDFSWKENRTRR